MWVAVQSNFSTKTIQNQEHENYRLEYNRKRRIVVLPFFSRNSKPKRKTIEIIRIQVSLTRRSQVHGQHSLYAVYASRQNALKSLFVLIIFIYIREFGLFSRLWWKSVRMCRLQFVLDVCVCLIVWRCFAYLCLFWTFRPLQATILRIFLKRKTVQALSKSSTNTHSLSLLRDNCIHRIQKFATPFLERITLISPTSSNKFLIIFVFQGVTHSNAAIAMAFSTQDVVGN